MPICLLLSLLECALIAVIYYFCSDGLGSLLQSREQKILETVTAKSVSVKQVPTGNEAWRVLDQIPRSDTGI